MTENRIEAQLCEADAGGRGNLFMAENEFVLKTNLPALNPKLYESLDLHDC